jgi:hypothetical protein
MSLMPNRCGFLSISNPETLGRIIAEENERRITKPPKPRKPASTLGTPRRIVDRRVLHLIKMWLDCPVEETDDRGSKTRTTEARDNRRGIPQGSPTDTPLGHEQGKLPRQRATAG